MAQRPAAFCFLAPQDNAPRCGKNPRPLRKEFKSLQNLVPGQIHRQVSGNPMHVHVPNIHDLPTADSLPCKREPPLRNVLPNEQMQVSRSVFLKFQHADEGKGFPELPRERDTHLPPALPDIAICTLPLRNPLRVECERSHALQFVLSGDLRDACADFFQFWIAATPTPVRLAEKRCVSKLPRLAFQWPDRRFVTTSEWFFPFQ